MQLALPHPLPGPQAQQPLVPLERREQPLEPQALLEQQREASQVRWLLELEHQAQPQAGSTQMLPEPHAQLPEHLEALEAPWNRWVELLI